MIRFFHLKLPYSFEKDIIVYIGKNVVQLRELQVNLTPYLCL